MTVTKTKEFYSSGGVQNSIIYLRVLTMSILHLWLAFSKLHHISNIMESCTPPGVTWPYEIHLNMYTSFNVINKDNVFCVFTSLPFKEGGIC